MAGRSKGPWRRKGRGWYVEIDGKQVKLAETKAEAWRAWHLLQAGEPIHDDAATLFRTVADLYVKFLKRTRSKRHAVDSNQRLDAFVQPWWYRAVDSLRWVDVETVLAGRKWNSTTQGNHLIALRGCLRWATKTRTIDANPLPHISIPRAQTRQNAMSKDQVAELLKHAPPSIYPILWALSVTGARPGELIGATVDQCDEDGSAIRLPTSKVGKRIVWFPPAARKQMATVKQSLTVGPLFPSPNGRHWNKRYFHEAYKEAREAAGLPAWATTYTIRHCVITEWLRAGMSMDDAALLAGTSAAMLERTYRHFIDADVRKIADRLG